jgi:RNA polymerase sigma factor (sigma-70 family)
MRELMRADIAQALLDELDDRERELVVLRYGLLDGEMHTLEVVGQHFNLTRERARQIQEHALDKLRAACGGLRAWVQ